MNKDRKIWVARGGTKGEADDLFLRENVIALGPQDIDDLGALDSSRAAFKDAY